MPGDPLAATAVAASVVIFQTVVLQGVMFRLASDPAAGLSGPAAAAIAGFQAHLRLISWAALAIAVGTGIMWLVLAPHR